MFKRVALATAAIFALGLSAQAAEWKIDTKHSSVAFKVSHLLVAKATGNFTDFSGTINYDGKDFSAASTEVTIQAASINTDNEDRDGHLKSPDFFAVDSFPTITFKSTKITPVVDNKFTIFGDLTMKGTTKPVTLEAEYNGSRPTSDTTAVAGFSAVGKINRQDFNVKWNQPLEGGGFTVGDEVSLFLEVEARSKKSK
ncbi:MAG: YceI family protein [candidate division Zixibacteria bacterium]|nr:YceI family protein [candidate division Zixibacteria bacterium]